MRTLAMALPLFFLACGGSKTAKTTTENVATAVKTVAGAGGALEPRSGSKVTGFVHASPIEGGVHLDIRVANATPGKHGVHIHEKGDCSAPDGTSAGGHFNPTNAPHGAPGTAPHHAGDLGNIEVGADGTGTLSIDVPGVTLTPGPTSIVGRSVIVHGGEDDLTSQPSGNSGPRVACGVIVEAP